jgi:predicted patatin/cPLA2 family phospholipase
MRRALIIGPGGLRGAYGGGVVATLCRAFGHGYFEKIYGCSAGAYTGSYAASGQPDHIESIWRECLHADLLVDVSRAFRGSVPILDLFYLNDVLRSERHRLSISDMLALPTALEIVTTDRGTGQPHYFLPQSEEEFFLQVRASAAVPVFHPKVSIGGRTYVDGSLSDPFPLAKALADGYEEVVVVCNRSLNGMGLLMQLLLRAYAVGTGQWSLSRVLERMEKAIDLAKTFDRQVQVISPSQRLPHRWQFDSSYETLNRLVDLGIQDATAFVRRLGG